MPVYFLPLNEQHTSAYVIEMDYKKLFVEIVEALEKFKVRDQGIREYITAFVEEKYDKVCYRFVHNKPFGIQ